LSRGRPREDVRELIAKKRYTRALQVLRQQLTRPGVTVNQRLQLADLLVQLGRPAEAVPVFIGLAEELAKDGFTARAIAALKRVEKLDPGQPHVEARLAALARQGGRTASMLPSATPLPLKPPPPSGPELEIGIEEVGSETLVRLEGDRARRAAKIGEEPAKTPADEAPASPPPAPSPEAAPTSPESAASWPPVVAAVDEAAPALRDPSGAASSPASAGVADRLRGVFRRFLAALPAPPPTPSAEPAVPATPVPTAAPEIAGLLGPAPTASPEPAEPTAAAPEAAAPSSADATASEAPAASEPTQPAPEPFEEILPRLDLHDALSAEPETDSVVDVSPIDVDLAALETEGAPLPPKPPSPTGPSPAAPPTPALPGRADEMDAFLTMSEDIFQDQVADLIEEMLVPPAEGAGPAVGEALPQPARSLLTGPLFEGLSDDERVALVRGLKLRTFESGDVILTEGETAGSLFLLTAGAVKVFVRNPAGHNLLLDNLGEGDFFGEIATLSGRPRTATVTAAALCELLELDQASMVEIAVAYPHVNERLQALSRERAGDPEAAALRGREAGAGGSSLESQFHDGRGDPRMRLRLADAFLKAGKDREAAQVLVDLADDLVRRGQNEKAVALLKKVEQLQRRPRNAALRPAGPASPAGPAAPSSRPAQPGNLMREWLIDVVRDTVKRRSAVAERALDTPAGPSLTPETLRAYGRGLVASPLFNGLTEDELLALVRGLELRTLEPGDIVLTEGEPGQSVFLVATGRVKVFIRNRSGQDVLLRPLGEGAFFGEISALSGRSRTATVTAAAPCALLELDRSALDTITKAHPRVREILENVYIERAGDPDADAIRRS
jgi:CRP-like cAMP-binding protein